MSDVRDSSSANLPKPLTSFIGRETEEEAIVRLLRPRKSLSGGRRTSAPGSIRLLTLTGSPGSGKTRLAIEVAHALIENTVVHFIDLTALRDPALMVPTVARSLGVRQGTRHDLIARIAAHIGDDSMLLVLDNFEHVLTAARGLIDILAACPNVRALVTSRAPLRVSGEHEFPVLPLAVPTYSVSDAARAVAENPAVRLFVERARAVRPGVALDSNELAAVAEICRRLDGLPLAIELAAARVRILAPREIAKRLDSRFPLLNQGPLDLPTRQRTLRDAIAWSYELLDESERRLFRLLGVFAGGCSLAAVEGVVDEVMNRPFELLTALESLVAKSLLQGVDEAETPRFRMLETVREYACERLHEEGEASRVRDAHAAYFLSVVVQARPMNGGMDGSTSRRLLEREQDNFREALHWMAVSGDVKSGLRLTRALSFMWWQAGYIAEGTQWLSSFLADARAQRRDLDRAEALEAAGAFARRQRDSAAAQAYLEESASIQEELGNLKGLSLSLRWLGAVLLDEDDLEAAHDALSRSLVFARSAGDRFGEAQSLSFLGEHRRATGDFAGSERLNLESVDLFRTNNDSTQVAIALQNAGFAAARQGALDRALQYFRESLEILGRHRGTAESVISLVGLALWAASTSRVQEAVQLFAVVDRELQRMGVILATVDQRDHDLGLSHARAALTEEDFTRAWSEGRAMSLESSVEFALDISAAHSHVPQPLSV